MLPVSQKNIKGKTYTITLLDGWTAWDGWTLILNTIAPATGAIFDKGMTTEEQEMFQKNNTFENILGLVAKNISDPKFTDLIHKMLNGAQVDGVALNVEDDFRGKVHIFMEVVMFALEENFKGFFTESDTLQSLLGKVMNLATTGIGSE